MTLASRRDMVDQINESRLEAIDKPVFTFIGEIKKISLRIRSYGSGTVVERGCAGGFHQEFA